MSRWNILCVMALLSTHALSPAQAPDANPTTGKVVATFLKAARTGDGAALEAAAQHVRKAGKEALSLLGTALSGRTPAELVAGMRFLRSAKAGDRVVDLQALTVHVDPDVRAESMWLCAEAAGAAPLAWLHRGAADPAASVKRRAFDALLSREARDRQTLELAIAGILDSDWWISSQSGRILGSWPVVKKGPDLVAQALGAMVPDLGPASAPTVFSILAHRMGKRAAPYLSSGMAHKTSEVAIAAIKATARLRLRVLSPTLRKLFRRGDAVALAAVQCVAELQDRQSVRPLVKLLARGVKSPLKEAVALSLRHITGQIHGYDVARWEEYLRYGFEANEGSRSN